MTYFVSDDSEEFKQHVMLNWPSCTKGTNVQVQTHATWSRNASFRPNPGFTTWFTLRELRDFYQMVDSLQSSVDTRHAYDWETETYAITWRCGITTNHPTNRLYISMAVRDTKYDEEE